MTGCHLLRSSSHHPGGASPEPDERLPVVPVRARDRGRTGVVEPLIPGRSSPHVEPPKGKS